MHDEWSFEMSAVGPPIDQRAIDRARAALQGIPETGLTKCNAVLDEFLNARARTLGYTRTWVRLGCYGGVQWFPVATTALSQGTPHDSGDSESALANGSLPNVYRPLDDIEGLATAFGRDTETELNAFLGSIHVDWVLALTLVLAILVDRAARANNAAAIDRAEDIGLLLLPRVTRLAWDRGNALAKQAAGGRKGGGRAHREAKRPDNELRKLADAALARRVPTHKLTKTILESCGEQFGGERYLRARLTRLGYRHTRKRN